MGTFLKIQDPRARNQEIILALGSWLLVFGFWFLVLASHCNKLYFYQMRIIPLIFFLVIWGCVPPSSGPPEKAASIPKSVEIPPPFKAGLMNDYDVWEFLNVHPSKREVLNTLGQPDSVWVDDQQQIEILYYFIPRLQDYNSVELDMKTKSVTGFEWD